MKTKSMLLMVLGLGTAYLITRKKDEDTFKSVTLSQKKSRVITPIETTLGSLGITNDMINQVILELPKTSLSKYDNVAKNANATKMKSILQSNYSNYQQAEKLTNVPAYVTLPITFAESGGNPRIVSSARAIGMMQMKTQTANDTILQENIKGRLTDAEKEVLRKFIGNRLDNILRMKYLSHKAHGNNGKTNFITESDLMNPEFNILVGSMLIGILMDQHVEGSNLRLDKAMLRYGRGYFFKPKGENFSETLNSVKKYAENYSALIKYFGKNGLFQTALNVVKDLK